jgi:6-pyruvoyltetrahydropterin/6-carboxytetrahydropterin synthase
MYIRVTKEFRFEMAHALLGHDGPCKNIHGHSYQFSITLKGCPVKNTKDPKTGMVVDFSDIKKLVTENIINLYDHALVLNKTTPASIYEGLKDQKLILLDFQPTCENLLIYFAKKLKNILPPDAALHHLLLRETSTSYAEWYAEDNELIGS